MTLFSLSLHSFLLRFYASLHTKRVLFVKHVDAAASKSFMPRSLFIPHPSVPLIQTLTLSTPARSRLHSQCHALLPSSYLCPSLIFSHICSHHPPIDFFILSMSALPSRAPLCLHHIALHILHPLTGPPPSLLPSFNRSSPAPLPLSLPPPVVFLLTRSPCHWAKPAYLRWNKSTSSHGHFAVLSFF